MQQDLLDKIRFLVGDPDCLEDIGGSSGVQPFSPDIIDFLDALSVRLMGDKEARQYSDIVTFAFWCRRSSILKMKAAYRDLPERKGRGLTFHIAPSNIPVMFAFSMAVSLLAGNANIVRLSSREFPQAGIICRHINQLLDNDFHFLKGKNVILTYPHDVSLTEFFSGICDSRIIWGGNRSIGEIRKFPLSPYAIDLPFFDRFSFSLIDVDKYLDEGDAGEIAGQFYNDTYFTDQNACTSPQLVVWLCRDADRRRLSVAQDRFWTALHRLVDERYRYQDIQSVDKIDAMSRYSIRYGDGKMAYPDFSLVRIMVERLHSDLKDYRCPGGYFYEYATSDIRDIRTVCTKDCQTISYYGADRAEILDSVDGCRGVDRIVPIGKTMDFGLRWDGFDFILSLSRIIA